MYDIIGDIHGQATLLHNLLHRMGYTHRQGCYRHASRQAIFLGDFINKGSQTRQVLETVRAMVVGGAARAVPGNHELHLVGYFTRHKLGEYIRPHTEENTAQHQPTLDAFRGEEAMLQQYIAWFKTLPLSIALDGCRIVHAFWHRESIAWLKQHYPENCLSDRLLHELVPEACPAWQAVSELLIGLKLNLPEQAGGEPFKVRWWQLPRSHRYFDLAIRPDEKKGNVEVPVAVDTNAYTYPPHDKPLFFGHYNLPGLPRLTGDNYACLDFSLPGRALVIAYRWDGEQTLHAEKMVYV